MSQTKHTPGPWRVDRFPGQKEPVRVRHWVVTIPGVDNILVGKDGGPDNVHETDGANARLIAAAPDLLAALDALVAACELTGEQAALTRRVVTERARAAIARAKGETP